MTRFNARFPLFLTVLFAVAATLPACDSVVETEPEQEVARSNAFTDLPTARSTTLGVYEGLQTNGVFGGIGLYGADISTSNAYFGGSFVTYENVETYNLNSTSGPAFTIWVDTYEMINAANEVVARVGDSGIPAASATAFEAEARFLRALGYFHLLRWYSNFDDPSASGVVLSLTPTEAPGQQLNRARSSVGEVYSQINTDLQAAYDALGSEDVRNATTGGGVSNQSVVRALQARVALYEEDYEEAASFAGDVIDSGNYELLEDVAAVFGGFQETDPVPTTNGDILTAINTASDNAGTNAFPSSFYRPGSTGFGGRGDITVGPPYLEILNDSLDERQTDLVFAVTGPGQRAFGVTDAQCGANCFTDKYRDDSFGDDIKILRFAEQYLIRAEANARLDNEEQALSDLNTVRTRAGLPEFDNDDYDDLVAEIVQERRRELAFEGDYRHDLLRRGEPLSNGQGITASETDEIFPIPQDELDANPAIQQNPGY